MSHREQGLHPWITNETCGDSPVTDAQKHAWCQRRGYPHAVFLAPRLYADAEANGYDMRWYVINKPIPTTGHGEVFTITHEQPTRAQKVAEINRRIAAGEPLGASHVPTIKPGVYANGSLNYDPSYLTKRGNPK